MRLSTSTPICAEVQSTFEEHAEVPVLVEDELRAAGRADLIDMVRARTGAAPSDPSPVGASSRASSHGARKQASLLGDGVVPASSSSTGGPLDGNAMNDVNEILKRAEARQAQQEALLKELVAQRAPVLAQAAPTPDGGFGNDLMEVHKLQEAGALSEDEVTRASEWILDSVAPPNLVRDLKAVFTLYEVQRNENSKGAHLETT